jgi:hypothetical protein
MIYNFKSKATGDLIMLEPNGDEMLRILGREPAAKGIIEVADMDAAMAALHQAVGDQEARAAEADAGEKSGVSLRQRLWPMVEMLKRAQAANQPVVWGV